MRTLLAPVFWLGRVTLWILVFPIGIWRSLRHHRKKGQRKTIEAVRKEMRKDG